MNRTLTALATAAAITLAAGAQARDIPIENDILVHGDSAGSSVNNKGITVAHALVTYRDLKKGTARKLMEFVGECEEGFGETATANPDGSLRSRGFWARTGGTVGDEIAMAICVLATENEAPVARGRGAPGNPIIPNRRSF